MRNCRPIVRRIPPYSNQEGNKLSKAEKDYLACYKERERYVSKILQYEINSEFNVHPDTYLEDIKICKEETLQTFHIPLKQEIAEDLLMCKKFLLKENYYILNQHSVWNKIYLASTSYGLVAFQLRIINRNLDPVYKNAQDYSIELYAILNNKHFMRLVKYDSQSTDDIHLELFDSKGLMRRVNNKSPLATEVVLKDFKKDSIHSHFHKYSEKHAVIYGNSLYLGREDPTDAPSFNNITDGVNYFSEKLKLNNNEFVSYKCVSAKDFIDNATQCLPYRDTSRSKKLYPSLSLS